MIDSAALDPEKLAAMVRADRATRGLSQDAYGRQIGLSQDIVCALELGRPRRYSVRVRMRLRDRFGPLPTIPVPRDVHEEAQRVAVHLEANLSRLPRTAETLRYRREVITHLLRQISLLLTRGPLA